MSEIHWGVWNYIEASSPGEQCRHRRGRYGGNTYCELPVDHIVGRNHQPFFELAHFGRGPSGNWYSWAMDLDRYTDSITECRRLRLAAGLPVDPPWWPAQARAVVPLGQRFPSADELRPFMGQWVAISAGKVVADSSDLTVLVTHLRESGTVADGLFRVAVDNGP